MSGREESVGGRRGMVQCVSSSAAGFRRFHTFLLVKPLMEQTEFKALQKLIRSVKTAQAGSHTLTRACIVTRQTNASCRSTGRALSLLSFNENSPPLKSETLTISPAHLPGTVLRSFNAELAVKVCRGSLIR